MPAPFIPPPGKDAIQKAKVATDAIDDADTLIGVIDSPPSLPVTLIQDQLFENILDFIYGAGGAANCALAGGTSCGGWKGPQLQLPFVGTIGNLMEDPPSASYRTIIIPQEVTVAPLQSGPNLPATRAAVLNALMEASLDLNGDLFASAVSYDRYAGAAAAGDLEWAALQSSAYLHYLERTARAMVAAGDRIDGLLQAIRDEGIRDVHITEAAFRTYQTRLAQEGFTATEIQAAELVGLDANARQHIRQRRLAEDPAKAEGSILPRWASLAAALRAAGDTLLSIPAFGSVAEVPTTPVSEDGTQTQGLVRLSETVARVPVRNPREGTATIELRLRRLGVPADWMVRVAPRTLTLPPGQEATVTVTLQPGTSAVQATQPRIAVEGYVDGSLINGVVVGVMIPRPRTYKVKPGDTLSKIADQQLGDANRWPEIFVLNRPQIRHRDRISIGQVLTLPATPMQPPPKLYKVRRGDTLSQIAEQQLGDANRWPDIFALNRDIISDPDRITPGQVLVILPT
jgi:nucleoid-associated protein YgaU